MDQWWIWMIVGYASGSIPFGLLMGKLAGVDIRKVGSGNVGATNVGRALGKGWGVLCFVLDMLKGALPVLVGGCVLGYAGRTDLSHDESWRWLSVAAGAMVGHVFPAWLGFKGGKGAATGLGVMLGFWPILTWPGVGMFVTWLLWASTFRYVSLASVMAALSLPVYIWLAAVAAGRSVTDWRPILILSTVMALLVVVRHVSNIRRLIRGVEPRLGEGGAVAGDQ